MVHKPYTPRNDFNFTRTGKELFHEYTAPLCIVMPKLQHRYRAEGLLSICLGIIPPCSSFAAFKALVLVLFGHYGVSSWCRFLRGSDQFNCGHYNGSFAATLSLGLSHFSSAEEGSPFNSISFCRRDQFRDIQCLDGSILDEGSEGQWIFCTTMHL